jgi:hypothetical protein
MDRRLAVHRTAAMDEMRQKRHALAQLSAHSLGF